MNTKHCTKCNKEKPLSEFHKRNASKDGYVSICSSCAKIYNDAYMHSKNGLITWMYINQIYNSKYRNHSLPSYSKEEFREWINNQVHFDCLYLNWINSGYNTWKKPSVDRSDDYKPYTLNNLLKVCTWQENFDRGHSDRKNGINNKMNTAVSQFEKNNLFIAKYHSQQQAGRITGVPQSNINKCCKGSLKTAGGFKWRYS